MEFLLRLFDTDDFPARWGCGNWSPGLGWLHIISDSLIFLAYTAIPIGLLVVMVRRRDFPFPILIGLFSAFILFCGIGHLLEAIIFYEPVYRFAGVWKAGTATVSLLTAGVLIRAMPSAMSLPSIQRANDRLTRSLARERELTEELKLARNAMESHTAKLTSRSRKMTDAAMAARVVACRWTIPDAVVEWEVGFAEGAQQAGYRGTAEFGNWSDLLDAPTLGDAVACWERGAEAGEPVDLELPLLGGDGALLRVSAAPEPRVSGQPRVMVGMFRFVRA